MDSVPAWLTVGESHVGSVSRTHCGEAKSAKVDHPPRFVAISRELHSKFERKNGPKSLFSLMGLFHICAHSFLY
jgi:hypothetical protein